MQIWHKLKWRIYLRQTDNRLWSVYANWFVFIFDTKGLLHKCESNQQQQQSTVAMASSGLKNVFSWSAFVHLALRACVFCFLIVQTKVTLVQTVWISNSSSNCQIAKLEQFDNKNICCICINTLEMCCTSRKILCIFLMKIYSFHIYNVGFYFLLVGKPINM